MSSIAAQITPRQRGLISATAIIAMSMIQVDTTVANVALTDIQGSLGASRDQISWVLTSYLIASAIGTPLSGALINRLGFRRLYVLCILGFAAASMLCGFALSLNQLVAFRVLQGLTGAAFQPLVQTLMLDIYPREKYGSAMANFGIASMIAPIIGPLLGGYLTDTAGWRWIFFINLPVAVFALVAMLALMPKTPTDRSQPFDFTGFSFLAIALACIQLIFDRGPGEGWFGSSEIIIYAALLALSFYLFLVQTLTTRNPFVDLALFRDRNFVYGNIVTFATGIVAFAPLATIPMFLQGIQGYDAFQAGLLLCPRAIVFMVPMLIVGNLVNRIDSRLLLGCGMAFSAIGLFILHLVTADSPPWVIVVGGGIQAFGLGFTFVPLNIFTFANLPPHLRAMGASMSGLTRSLGMSLGVAIVMGVLGDVTDANYVRLIEKLNEFNPAMSVMPSIWSLRDPMMLKLLSLEAWRQANVIAFSNAYYLLFILTLVITPIVLILRSPKKVIEAPPEAALSHA